MTRLDDLLPDEFRSEDAELAFNLADEDEHLLGKLVQLREARGLTQQQVADALGLTQATISAFERLGNDPRMSTVRRYCRAIGVMVRHHVDESACSSTASEMISHVSSEGVDVHQTASAVSRNIKSSGLNWPSVSANLAVANQAAAGRVFVPA